MIINLNSRSKFLYKVEGHLIFNLSKIPKNFYFKDQKDFENKLYKISNITDLKINDHWFIPQFYHQYFSDLNYKVSDYLQKFFRTIYFYTDDDQYYYGHITVGVNCFDN